MAAQPGYMDAFDALFGDSGYQAFLSSSAPSGAGVAPASKEQPPEGDLSDPVYAQQLADHYGWNALPETFDVSKVTGGQTYGSGEATTGPLSYSDPNWKGENRVFRNQADSGAKDEFGGSANSLVDSGYRVVAGSVPGTDRFTRAYYNYDDAGKFSGVTTEADTKWYEDAAPLIGMAGMALGFGGAFAGVGGAINSGLNLGLGKVGTAALGGAAVGGGTAALTGQNPLKGAALGALGAGVTAANPAGALGIVDKGLTKATNSLISSTAKAGLSSTMRK